MLLHRGSSTTGAATDSTVRQCMSVAALCFCCCCFFPEASPEGLQVTSTETGRTIRDGKQPERGHVVDSVSD